MKRLLLLSSDLILCKYFKESAKENTIQLIISSDLTEGINIVEEGKCDAIVVNIPLLSEQCPKRILQNIQGVNPYLPTFIMMDQMDLTLAISLTKMGAEYCYSKPFAFDQIFENIHGTLNELSVPRVFHKPSLGSNSNRPKYLQAKSKAAEYLYSQIDKVADTNFKVIIYGETGTGKEAVARRLSNGKYKNKPFVAVDCGCLNKELAASELFGHKKGSFSGAIEDKKGAFEEANGGTIFLDEIGNLDYSVQILLLRAIEEKRIKRIGSNDEIEINTRIVVASNEKLSDAVQNGIFREDLYYRLNEFEIIIPPLRERIEDIELFIDFFIQEANEDLEKSIVGIDPILFEKFKHYQWPGNIRELKNIIRRGCLMATKMITESCMSTEFIYKLNQQIKEQEYSSSKKAVKNNLKSKSIIAEYEEIIKVLKEENYNKTRTAERLNINRKTLYNKLTTFNKMKATNAFM